MVITVSQPRTNTVNLHTLSALCQWCQSIICASMSPSDRRATGSHPLLFSGFVGSESVVEQQDLCGSRPFQHPLLLQYLTTCRRPAAPGFWPAQLSPLLPATCKVPLQHLSVWVESRAARTQRAPTKITKAECVCAQKGWAGLLRSNPDYQIIRSKGKQAERTE